MLTGCRVIDFLGLVGGAWLQGEIGACLGEAVLSLSPSDLVTKPKKVPTTPGLSSIDMYFVRFTQFIDIPPFPLSS